MLRVKLDNTLYLVSRIRESGDVELIDPLGRLSVHPSTVLSYTTTPTGCLRIKLGKPLLSIPELRKARIEFADANRASSKLTKRESALLGLDVADSPTKGDDAGATPKKRLTLSGRKSRTMTMLLPTIIPDVVDATAAAALRKLLNG
jgi:hypothetical protein